MVKAFGDKGSLSFTASSAKEKNNMEPDISEKRAWRRTRKKAPLTFSCLRCSSSTAGW
jgi:hypothetical protein